MPLGLHPRQGLVADPSTRSKRRLPIRGKARRVVLNMDRRYRVVVIDKIPQLAGFTSANDSWCLCARQTTAFGQSLQSERSTPALCSCLAIDRTPPAALALPSLLSRPRRVYFVRLKSCYCTDCCDSAAALRGVTTTLSFRLNRPSELIPLLVPPPPVLSE